MHKHPQLIKPLGVDVFVIKKTTDGPKYLIIRRCGKHHAGVWQMVSGTCEPGELAWQTALREIFEETGLQVKSLYSADIINTFYEVRRDAILLLPVFVAFIDENHQEVKLSPTEHDEYKWVTFQAALEYLTFEGNKKALKHINQNFIDTAPNEYLRISIK